ncbi:MAG: hypothetical protein KGM17_14735, partial [Sphingomonadales bacterium]|nr:hypothetical protein [Sphingomonadales bacterium]
MPFARPRQTEDRSVPAGFGVAMPGLDAGPARRVAGGGERLKVAAHLRNPLWARALLLAGVVGGVLMASGQFPGFDGGALAATGEEPAPGAGDMAIAPMPFEKPGDSFPGSAFYYLDASAAGAPAPQ